MKNQGRGRLGTATCRFGSLAIWIILAVAGRASAQGPQVDVGAPPGVPDSRGKIGPALGASGGASFETAPDTDRPIGGKVGTGVSRAPISGLATGGGGGGASSSKLNAPQRSVIAADLPKYGDLDLPTGVDVTAVGDEGGMTLDNAIAVLIDRNLDVIALRFEIPMAQADILTAGLRANPVFYADSQLVPFGRYSNTRPGGPTQYDVNITIPLDVTRKRPARVVVAKMAKKVTEAQFQDAIRQQIDNLYTIYVDVEASELTLKYSKVYLDGINKLLKLYENLLNQGQIVGSKVDALKSQVEQAQLQVREATETLRTARRNLALQLNVPRDQAEQLRIRDALRDVRELPETSEELIGRALKNRPDLLANRFGLGRSKADVELARRNRYSDVYLLLQPYTFQNNTYLGLKSPTSYAVGLTANVPVFNRNQGNIQRANLNARQTEFEVASLERQVVNDVEAAVRQFDLTRVSVIEFEKEIVPAAKRVRDSSLRLFQSGQTSPEDYIVSQREFNEVVKQYRDALVNHRRDMLDLNTAVGMRLLP